MQVDLSDASERLLVQTYLNHILNHQSEEELNFLKHKIIHTYEVVEAAKDLVSFTKPSLSERDKALVLQAALLHDIGRVQQFSKGKYVPDADHGLMGAALLKKAMPENKIIIETTKWHNKSPSDKDPAEASFYLNYVRDADIIANIRHNTDHILTVFQNLKNIVKDDELDLYLDDELICAAKEKRSCNYKCYKRSSFLQVILQEIGWKYNILTPAGKRLVKNEQIFVRLRDAVIHELVDVLDGTVQEKRKMKKFILDLYPNEVLNED